MNPKPLLVVFDLAGTTVAATDGIADAIRGAFADCGIEVTSSAIERVRGWSKRQAIAELLATALADRVADGAERIYAAFTDRLEQYHAAHPPQAIAGTEGVFRWLRQRDIAIALNTGLDRDPVQQMLVRLGWGTDLIAATVCAQDVRLGRPAPDMIFRAMQLTSVVDARRVVVVGDTVADLEAANNAGAHAAIGVLSGAGTRAALLAAPHTALLESVAQLPAWLEAVSSE